MANQIIPGKHGATLISDSHAPYGEVGGTPAVVEDASRWAPSKFKYDDVLRRYGWSDEQYSMARVLGFPGPMNGQGLGRELSRWDLEKIQNWERDIRTLAETLSKK